MSQNIDGKVVVITGASSGLGEATARYLLAKEGAKLALDARRIDRLRALAKELNLPDSAVVQTDVTDREQVKRLLDEAVAAHGRIDVDVAKGIQDFYESFAIPAENFARVIAFAINQPEDVDVNEILFRATAQEL